MGLRYKEFGSIGVPALSHPVVAGGKTSLLLSGGVSIWGVQRPAGPEAAPRHSESPALHAAGGAPHPLCLTAGTGPLPVAIPPPRMERGTAKTPRKSESFHAGGAILCKALSEWCAAPLAG